MVEFLSPEYVKDALSKLDISLTTLRDAIRGAGGKTLTDLDTQLGNIYGRLDVALSTRASESTLAAVKAQTDKLSFDASNYLRVNVSATVNPPNLDISLSSLRDALRGAGNKTLTDLDTDLNNIYGRLDVALSTRASETTLSGLSGKFPSASALGDSMPNPTTTVVGGALLGFDGTYWRRVRADSNGYLLVTANIDKARIWDGTDYLEINSDGSINVKYIDTNLSTRASETTLSGFSGKFPSASALGDSMSNPTTTVVGGANLVWTGSAWARVGGASGDFVGTTLYGVGVIPQWLPSRQAYLIDNINVTTTEGSTTIASPGAKILIVKNKGDVDAMIGLNASVPTTNPLIVRARTVRVITHRGVTAVYYKTSTGSTTLEIAYFN